MRRIRPARDSPHTRGDGQHVRAVAKYGYYSLYRMDDGYCGTRHNTVICDATFTHDDYIVLVTDLSWGHKWNRVDNVAICQCGGVVNTLNMSWWPGSCMYVMAISTCMSARARRRLGIMNGTHVYTWLGTEKINVQTCVDLAGHIPRNVHMLVGRRFQEASTRIGWVYRSRVRARTRRRIRTRTRTGVWSVNRSCINSVTMGSNTRVWSWRHPYDIEADRGMIMLDIDDNQTYEIAGTSLSRTTGNDRTDRIRGWVLNPDTVWHRYECDK